MKRKIAVNTRFLISNKLEGIGTYTHQVLQRLVKQMPEVEFHFLFDRDYSEEFIYADNVIAHKLSPQARHPFLWYLWFEFSLTKWLKENQVDLFLSLDSFLALKSETKTLLVIHDLAFEHYPKHTPFLVRKYYQYFFPKYAKKATKIFAVSKFTKQDLITKYKIKENKINIAYCGVSEVYKPLDKVKQQELRNIISKGNPYFISIGSLNPRKNTIRVVKAFNLFKEENKSSKHKLLIVGAKAWETNNLYKEINNSEYRKDIIILGHLPPTKLSKYLASSESLIFPSLFEGFGIPIIEAYKCKIPVITANVSSTKEIGKGTSILVDPKNVSEIKNAMNQVANDEKLTVSVLENREKKLLEYNWNKTTSVFKTELLKYLK